MKLLLITSLATAFVAIAQSAALAQSGYQRPPKEVLDILNAPPTPQITLSPTKDVLLLLQGDSYPPIAELARPMLRLAGLRINPRTSGPHRPMAFRTLTFLSLPGGREIGKIVSAQADLGMPSWSPDGKRIAYCRYREDRVELWIADVQSSKAHALPSINLLTSMGRPMVWNADSKGLLCQAIPEGRGISPAADEAPTGPAIQESQGKAAPVRTFQDLLKNSTDESRFEYHCTAQLHWVDVEQRTSRKIGSPHVYSDLDFSPDGQHLLVAYMHRPFSYLHPASSFPKEIEVWDLQGNLEARIASLPLEDRVPIEGVPTGPRGVDWVPTKPATLMWVEALDGGDPKKKVAPRDKVLLKDAPFREEPKELVRTEHRFNGITWGLEGNLALVRDFNRDTKKVRTLLVNPATPNPSSRVIWDRSIQDRYRNPGTPLMRTLANGKSVLAQEGNSLFLTGQGASPKGDFPFLDRFDLNTLTSTRLWQCPDKAYEAVVASLSSDCGTLLIRRESPTDPPNYFVRDSKTGESKPLTRLGDPFPQLRQIKKELVTYKRADGVPLSFTLYLPASYQPGQRLPTVVWAYPREFSDSDTAGQVSGSIYHFTRIVGPSHLFYLTQGYAILDDATMPVVGDPETANNTFIEQIVASAKAAIDKADEMGVTDRNRVGVGGHSYGAFMTANLLAHSSLFKAGVARSGAYNRTLTPFGFQSERRTIWEAPDIYLRMSPFMHAHKLKTPILFIHGEADNNSGTFPIQSDRMYQAVKGNGGIARYVTLPGESHGYAARESIEHTLYEMLTWFERYVKNPVTKSEAGGSD